MNITKVIIAALLLSGITMSAKEIDLLKTDGTGEFSKAAPGLSFRKKHQPGVILGRMNALLPASARNWDESEVNGGGFFLNVGIHFPFASFLAKDYQISDPRYRAGNSIAAARYKMGFDFEFGSYFRFAKINDDKVGIGLRATWLSVSYAKMINGADIYRTAQICPVKLGPQVGIAINETMGVDVFYQLGFNLTEEFGSISDPANPSKNKGASSTYTGISHELGAAYHYKVYSLGLGVRFGRLKNTLNVYDGDQLNDNYLDSEKKSIANFRITLGVKF